MRKIIHTQLSVKCLQLFPVYHHILALLLFVQFYCEFQSNKINDGRQSIEPPFTCLSFDKRVINNLSAHSHSMTITDLEIPTNDKRKWVSNRTECKYFPLGFKTLSQRCVCWGPTFRKRQYQKGDVDGAAVVRRRERMSTSKGRATSLDVQWLPRGLSFGVRRQHELRYTSAIFPTTYKTHIHAIYSQCVCQ